MSKEVLNFGLDLSEFEESRLMTLIIYLHWKDEGAHYQSVGASSNPTKVGELDFTVKFR
jgi:hypothetical protein